MHFPQEFGAVVFVWSSQDSFPKMEKRRWRTFQGFHLRNFQPYEDFRQVRQQELAYAKGAFGSHHRNSLGLRNSCGRSLWPWDRKFPMLDFSGVRATLFGYHGKPKFNTLSFSILCLSMTSLADLGTIFKMRTSRRRRSAMLKVCHWYSSTFLFKQPRHTSILTGEMWVKEVLNGNPIRMQNTSQMSRDIFDILSLKWSLLDCKRPALLIATKCYACFSILQDKKVHRFFRP